MQPSKISALEKIVRILDLLTDSTQPLTAAEIARQLDLPRSTVHALVVEMVQRNILRKVDERRLTVGRHVVYWSNGYLAKQDLINAFYDCVAELPQLAAYTLTLSALQGDKVMYLACKNSDSPLGFSFRIGMQAPAVYTATGKFLLSTLSEAQVRAQITAFPPPETDASVQHMEALLAELAAVRERGYAIDNGQLRRGMFCYGVGICGANGIAQYGIAVSLIEAEADAQTVAARVADLQLLAKKLEVIIR